MTAKQSWVESHSAEFDYWLYIALGVFLVWRVGQLHDNTDIMLHLSGATFMLIHAHGKRILAEIKKQAKDHE